MKKMMTMTLAAALMLPSCTKDEERTAANDGMVPITISFTFPEDVRTRGTLSEAGVADLWLFDYVGGELSQTIHQQSADDGFGTVTLAADYGVHELYFVASAGKMPTVSGTEISWEKPNDTFWQSATLSIEPGGATSATVRLQRVATRLRLAVTDEVPTVLATLRITPSRWFNAIDYLTGEAAGENADDHNITVPASYGGTTGQLSVSMWSLSQSEPWTADVRLQALTADGSAIADITLSEVPFERNRLTRYSGQLFGALRSLSLTVDDEWMEDYEAEW